MSDTRFDLQRAADLEDELLAEFRSSASAVATRFQAYRREIAKCYAEIDRLEAKLSSPAPDPVPTWTPPANFADGDYVIDLAGASLPSGAWTSNWVLQDLTRGLYERPALGRWRVESGRATYLGPNEVTQ